MRLDICTWCGYDKEGFLRCWACHSYPNGERFTHAELVWKRREKTQSEIIRKHRLELTRLRKGYR